ncbi:MULTISPECIES: DNA cytosine methyltransferase [Dehalococcoides]|uniref:DNA cytosine methyltransferase n=1 Tax=Dehalococcoides TaxID=61434 RepID=UPI00062D764C|nr:MULTISPECIES: DNA cytosine methyltransferase [Dehalococcoides]QYY58596.1 DNA cytosine methyltransferase [Dehalococcoides mccartyi]
MKVAVLCEKSRRVASAFEALGHDAVSCDILPAEQPGNHIQGDIRDYDWHDYDLVIAHPPCTYLCNAGVRWLHRYPDRWKQLQIAAEFFRWCLGLPCKRLVVENPIPSSYALKQIGLHYDQIIQPYHYGDAARKATCLWLKGVPPLMAEFSGREGYLHNVLQEHGDRAANRSRTYPGIARAMAEQWGRI